MSSLLSPLRRRRRRGDERGAALVELAISVPIFVLLLSLIFDFGLGFAAAEDSSGAVRSAARVAALSGDDRLADYRAIEAVRAQYASRDDNVVWMTVYRSEPAGSGAVPEACRPGGASVANVCNVYTGAQIEALTQANFNNPTCAGELDVAWCPTTRADDRGDFLGIGIWTTHEAAVGFFVREGEDRERRFELEDHAVFALYFPEPETP